MDFNKKPANEESQNTILNQLSRGLNDNIRRIRILEEKFDNTEGRLNTVEKRLMDDFQQATKSFAEIKQDLRKMSDRFANIEVDIRKLNTQTKKMISRKELIELQEYVNLMNPLTSKYITRKEAEELIRDNVSFKQ